MNQCAQIPEWMKPLDRIVNGQSMSYLTQKHLIKLHTTNISAMIYIFLGKMPKMHSLQGVSPLSESGSNIIDFAKKGQRAGNSWPVKAIVINI